MSKTTLLIDSHVHIYGDYDLEDFFSNALANLDRYHDRLYPEGGDYRRIFLLTEGKQVDFFARFKAGGVELSGGYSFAATAEGESLRLERDGEPTAYFIKGRQVVTKENLEVLHVAADEVIGDGLPMDDVLERIAGGNGIAVLAWGFGKWFFGRGKVIERVISENRYPGLFVGDNSGRPTFWPTPRPFKQARELGMRVLNGSDPLPFAGETGKAGSYGFALEGAFDEERPARSVRDILLAGDVELKSFGRRDGAVSFFLRQAKMYKKKYLG